MNRNKIEQVFNLREKVVLVTGAAGLIGSRFCQVLAQAGARLVAADIQEQKVGALVQDLQRSGLKAQSFPTDITSQESVRALLAQIKEQFGQLDVLVHCAAMDPKFDKVNKQKQTVGFEEYPLELWQQAMHVNLTGTFLCVQEAARLMVQQGWGNMVLVSSIYGMVAPDQRIYAKGFFKPPYYSVSKAGILGLTRYVASYYAGKNIRVNALSPGGIYHDHDELFVREYSNRTMLNRMADVSELEGALLFLASDASSYMSGANLVVDGGWTAW
jgi:NAD(P)-dependent dehydrogenase (short-subunit alcohol dehydrogenase family)